MTDEKLEQILQQALSPEIKDEEIRIRTKENVEEIKVKKINRRKIAVLVAAACLIIGGSAVAGNVTALVSGMDLSRVKTYKQFAKVTKTAGFDAAAVEAFDNGFAFSSADTTEIKAVDDDNVSQYKYKEVVVYYKNEADDRIMESVIEEQYNLEEPEYIPEPTETREIDGYLVTCRDYHYKFVPVDYVMTPEDEENIKNPAYQISYGSDEVEETNIRFVSWEKDGLAYSLMDNDTSLDLEELFTMAGTLIEQ